MVMKDWAEVYSSVTGVEIVQQCYSKVSVQDLRDKKSTRLT